MDWGLGEAPRYLTLVFVTAFSLEESSRVDEFHEDFEPCSKITAVCYGLGLKRASCSEISSRNPYSSGLTAVHHED